MSGMYIEYPKTVFCAITTKEPTHVFKEKNMINPTFSVKYSFYHVHNVSRILAPHLNNISLTFSPKRNVVGSAENFVIVFYEIKLLFTCCF